VPEGGGAPPPVAAPQFPVGAEPGSIIRWMVTMSAMGIPLDIGEQMGRKDLLAWRVGREDFASLTIRPRVAAAAQQNQPG
jgi:hypothetical protein